MAAAACLVLATLLMYAALGAGQPTILREFFPEGSLPPPVRIYCREDAALNVAVRNGNVVLANADCKDLSQKWHPVIPDSFLLDGQTELKPFWLMNAQTFQVIRIPSGSGQKVGLSSSPPSNPLLVPGWLQAAREELWTPEKPTRDDGFYQLFVTEDTTLTLNGLLGGVHDGTEVGIYSASPNAGNAIWKITPAPTCFP